MGKTVKLDTPHGVIGGWRADPNGPVRGGILVVQEIFGINAHIRTVVDRFASLGYATIAPALFDFIERDVELEYDEAGVARGKNLAQQVGLEHALDGVAAAAQALHSLATACIGYCWGGSVAFLANTRLGLPAVSYYGARTVPFLDEPCKAPMLFHFGERDRSISADDIERHRLAQPQAEFHVWPAGHGFNCEVRKDYDAQSAEQALAITFGFLERTLI